MLSEYAVTGIYVCMFAAAFVPPILGLDPFTYHYAKKYAPQAVWETPSSDHQSHHDLCVGGPFRGLHSAESVSICYYPRIDPHRDRRSGDPVQFPISGLLSQAGRFTHHRRDAENRIGRAHATSAAPGARTSPQSAPSTSDSLAPETFRSDLSKVSDATNQSQLRKETTMKVIAINSSPRG